MVLADLQPRAGSVERRRPWDALEPERVDVEADGALDVRHQQTSVIQAHARGVCPTGAPLVSRQTNPVAERAPGVVPGPCPTRTPPLPPSRPTPRLAEVRRMLDRYRRSAETARPRGARRPGRRSADAESARSRLVRARRLDLIPARRAGLRQRRDLAGRLRDRGLRRRAMVRMRGRGSGERRARGDRDRRHRGGAADGGTGGWEDAGGGDRWSWRHLRGARVGGVLREPWEPAEPRPAWRSGGAELAPPGRGVIARRRADPPVRRSRFVP